MSTITEGPFINATMEKGDGGKGGVVGKRGGNRSARRGCATLHHDIFFPFFSSTPPLPLLLLLLFSSTSKSVEVAEACCYRKNRGHDNNCLLVS